MADTKSTALKPRMMSPTRSTSPRRLISSAAISVPSSTRPRGCEADAGAEEEPAEHRGEHQVRRDVGERHEREDTRKAGDAPHGKGDAHLAPPTTRQPREARGSTAPGEGAISMPEMPAGGEHHHEATLVRRRDHFLVAHGPAGLHD